MTSLDFIKAAAAKGRLVQFRPVDKNKAVDDIWLDYTEPLTWWDGYEYRLGGAARLKEIQEKLIVAGNELQVLILREGWDEQIGEAIDDLEKVLATIGLEADALP